MQHFLQFRLGSHGLRLWVAFQVLVLWTGQQGCAPIVVGILSGMRCM